MTLPPLPDSLHDVAWDLLPKTALESVITKYGQQCREAALEEAAALCDGEQWRNEGKVSVAYIKAFNEGCSDCEEAIRRLK